MTEVTCGSCGMTLNEDASLKADERMPCPVCGSTARRGQVTVHALIGAGLTVSAAVISGSMLSIRAISDLLLQTVIVVRGDKTTEGILIKFRCNSLV